MSIVLVLIGLLILAVAAAGAIFLLSLTSRSQSDKKIHGLETEINSLKAELDKNIKTVGQVQEKNQDGDLAGRIISQINQGIICIDQNRKVQLVNSYAENFLLSTPAIGKSYQEIIKTLLNDAPDYSFFETVLMSGKSQILPGNVEIATQHGKIPITGIITPLPYANNTTTIAFIFADNSQNISRIQEEKAFFSAAAHELRTPLTAIRMSVLMMLQQFDELGKDKIIDYLTETSKSVEYLVNLVNDFLNVSRIDQGRMAVEIKPFNMIALTDEVIKELSLLAKDRKLYLNHEPVEKEFKNVAGDPIKSKEVLTNLISNSIKYTIQGGITISHQVTDTALITRITDTGTGIPPESQKLLFKRFFQIGQARVQSTTKSTGLGLYISKKIAQLMHGDVALESSEPGKGSTFTFTLPFATK